MRAPSLLRHHRYPQRPLAVPHLLPGHQATVRALPQQGRGHEEHEDWPEVGARVLRSLDTRGVHRGCREDGADHQDLMHSGKYMSLCVVLNSSCTLELSFGRLTKFSSFSAIPLVPGMCAVQGEGRVLYSVQCQDLQDCISRNLRLQE